MRKQLKRVEDAQTIHTFDDDATALVFYRVCADIIDKHVIPSEKQNAHRMLIHIFEWYGFKDWDKLATIEFERIPNKRVRYSQATKEKIIAQLNAGTSVRDVAARFNMPCHSVYTIRNTYRAKMAMLEWQKGIE